MKLVKKVIKYSVVGMVVLGVAAGVIIGASYKIEE